MTRSLALLTVAVAAFIVLWPPMYADGMPSPGRGRQSTRDRERLCHQRLCHRAARSRPNRGRRAASKPPAVRAPSATPRLALASGVAPSAESPALTSGAASAAGRTASRQQLYWGAWLGSHLTGAEAPWDFTAVSTFEHEVGKSVSLLNFSSPFADCSVDPCEDYTFPWAEFDKIRAHGAIPFFSWNSGSYPVEVHQPNYTLASIIEGRHDAYLRRWAAKARAWGHPFFLRFNWEMNGDWFPWSEGVNGNRAGEYVAAWRHVHDLFDAEGARNVTWVWCPNVDVDDNMTDLTHLYPGDGYVDWTGLDGYNWNQPWRTFETLFASTYGRISKLAPDKPMVVAETGSTEVGGDKARWISAMFDSLPRFALVRAVLYFDKYDSAMDWPIETSPRAAAAFAAGISDSSFSGNRFTSLATTKITPP